ncbi:PEP-CTERM sorting domain-containing protein [Aquabacterium sp. OR-4]|uniref:PEP-CTERM sorting domain-containing protein n=1 Tax=Aquabacterium sp. OR-4 TaxID=2978127 RepID=UPI0021B3D8BD|nr:PEP-CTERM sorting domain-containing protein [Aquabacterium sp. OR-4]MDT7838111.1 PEP-CTERM sorting domain-containing protein [Aquabacterium sp. OR-4]
MSLPLAPRPCGTARTARTAGLAAATLATALLATAQAQAAPLLQFAPIGGSGNVSVFDAQAGTGGWVGGLDGLLDPALGLPAPAVSTVLFTLDHLTQMLSGQFEFSTTDLASTLVGLVSGTVSDAAILTQGGQFSLDYTITGGSGLLADVRGYGLAFVDFDPAAGGSDNYRESGLLVYSVPEPASLLLTGLALCAMLGLRSRGQPIRG